MAFTWSGDPANSNLEAIRFLIDDTASSNAKFQDAEINYAYSEEGSVYGAVAMLCEQLSSKYASEPSRSLGPLRVDNSELASKYSNMAKLFRKKAMAYATPYCGGISESDKESYEDDSDVIQPIFERDMHKNE